MNCHEEVGVFKVFKDLIKLLPNSNDLCRSHSLEWTACVNENDTYFNKIQNIEICYCAHYYWAYVDFYKNSWYKVSGNM